MNFLKSIKKGFIGKVSALAGILSVSIGSFAQHTTDAYTTTGTHTFTVPYGVTSLDVQTWGAGGGGGGTSIKFAAGGNTKAAQGGGGGGFSSATIAVTSGDVVTISVGAGGSGGIAAVNGANGGNSTVSVNGTVLCLANGGNGGRFVGFNSTGSANGAGATITGAVGDVRRTGGSGSNGNDDVSGSGGGGAGLFGNGQNASNSSGGQGGDGLGGNGANGVGGHNAGSTGVVIGGGGSGARSTFGAFDWSGNTYTTNGGNGARGEVRISYCLPPVQPDPIAGLALLCPTNSGTYSIPPVANAFLYVWTMDNGLTGNSITNTIDITMGNASGTLTVQAVSNCGLSEPRTFTIGMDATPIVPTFVDSVLNPCQFVTGSFSVAPISNATNYVWTLPQGWNGASTTNELVGIIGDPGYVYVQAQNGCGISEPDSVFVDVIVLPAQPSEITGVNSICANDAGVYSVENVASIDSYIWVLPTTWTGASDSSSISIASTNEAGIITVQAVNACGVSAIRAMQVTVNPLPEAIGSITGAASLCEGTAGTYTVPAVTNATSYTWTLPADWTGNSTTNTISATSGATSGNISVVAFNTCGSSDTATFAVVANAISGEVVRSGDTLMAMQPNAVYQWMDCSTGIPIGGAAASTFIIPADGQYSVLIFTAEGCSVTSDCQTIVGLSADALAFEGLQVYPNPATDKLQLVNAPVGANVQLVDLTGKIVTQQLATELMSIDLTDMNAGVYFLSLQFNGASVTEKIVIRK